jgi:hypothetical protein
LRSLGGIREPPRETAALGLPLHRLRARKQRDHFQKVRFAKLMTQAESAISARARAVAEGLIRTKRARHSGVLDQGMLKLECMSGGFYWVSLDGQRLLRGDNIWEEAEELQPKFADAMERAAR